MPNLDSDEDLREEVNNALQDDENLEAADNDQDDVSDDDVRDDEGDDIEEDDDQDENQDRTSGNRTAPKANDAPDTDDEDDDDDPSIDFARPDFTPGSAQAKEFDIRTLPKDPETGLVDPVEANRLINEFYANQGRTQQQVQEQAEKTKNLLTTQWVRVSKKYPAVYSQPRLRDMARDMHLNSIGTDNYLTPAQAAAKVERIRKELVGKGYKSAKTRRTVTDMTRTERGSSRSANNGKLSDYEKAKAAANSRDPQKAKQGRMTLLRLRREARRRAG